MALDQVQLIQLARVLVGADGQRPVPRRVSGLHLHEPVGLVVTHIHGRFELLSLPLPVAHRQVALGVGHRFDSDGDEVDVDVEEEVIITS